VEIRKVTEQMLGKQIMFPEGHGLAAVPRVMDDVISGINTIRDTLLNRFYVGLAKCFDYKFLGFTVLYAQGY
jgi:hypothetical protein